MDWLAAEFPAFAQAVGEYRINGNLGHGRCPNNARHKHGDRSHSLLIKLADNGGLIFNCRAGCTKPEILGACQMTWRDVCHDRPRPKDWRPPQLVATFEYRRPDGSLSFVVQRFHPKPKARPQRLIATEFGEEWCRTLLAGSVKRVPDRENPDRHVWIGCDDKDEAAVKVEAADPWPMNADLLASQPGRLVWIVEGEKKADLLLKLGFLATTFQGGAQNLKWHHEWSELFRGRPVVVLPDNDAVSHDYAAYFLGRAAMCGATSVSTLVLPELGEKDDVCDYYARRTSELRAEQCRLSHNGVIYDELKRLYLESRRYVAN